MASVLLSPVGNGQQFFDNNGIPLNGGKIYTYQAGSSTNLSTYTNYNGTVANANPIVLDSAGRTPNEIWLLEGYSYKFIIKDSSDVTIQTLDNLYPILQNAPSSAPSVPSGCILMWSGSIGSIPSGWYLCDGTNSTPDLRDRFIVAAGSTYSVAATGGSADAIVVTHTHAATSVVTDAGHTHFIAADVYDSSMTALSATNQVKLGDSGDVDTRYKLYGTSTAATLGKTSSATTGVTVATTNANSGSSGTGANLPPYYALAFIMKG